MFRTKKEESEGVGQGVGMVLLFLGIGMWTEGSGEGSWTKLFGQDSETPTAKITLFGCSVTPVGHRSGNCVDSLFVRSERSHSKVTTAERFMLPL